MAHAVLPPAAATHANADTLLPGARACGDVRDPGMAMQGGCAQKCAETQACGYWLVHNSKGCILKKAATAALVAKKSFLSHGTC